MLKYFGLVKNDEDSQTGQIPIWHGATKKQRLISIALSLTLTVITYLTARWLLEDELLQNPQSYIRYVPGLLACQMLLLSGAIAERALLRIN